MIEHLTREMYLEAFDRERAQQYPVIDAIEYHAGYAIHTGALEQAAQVLACPVKAKAPNWQHGRVLYALTMRYLAGGTEPVSLLDIGTAKGFSALCLHWALQHSGRPGRVVSVDVINPLARVARNTIAELDGLKTLPEILAPWPEAEAIVFRQSTGIDWLQRHSDRVHVAFVDGKHTGHVVRQEGKLLAERQQAGDLVIFDDAQIGDVHAAIVTCEQWYRLRFVEVLPWRAYVIATRR